MAGVLLDCIPKCLPQGGKQVVFKQHDIDHHGEMNCGKGYSKYSTNGMAGRVLATFTLIVTMNSRS